MNQIKLFTNEHVLPGYVVLIINTKTELVSQIKKHINVLNCHYIFISDELDNYHDIYTNYDLLPFDDHSIDLVINFDKHFSELDRVLKPGGKVLIDFLNK